MAQISIDEKRCKKCGYCIAFCPKQVYGTNDGETPILQKPEECTVCLLCVKRCPDFAIRVEA